jgi:anti-sigma-K factor RskA
MDPHHHEVEELLGAYALDAVNDEERAAVDAHLADCPRCRAEVDGHREVASHLAQTGAAAPGELWDRIAGSIAGEEPPPMRLVVASSAPVAPRRSWRLPLAAAAAVLVLALVGAGLLLRSDDGGRGSEDLAGAALAAFESPRAQTADLLDDGGLALARVAVLPDGTGYVLADALPALDDRIYQLWGTDGETVVSLGAMGAAPQIVAFHADPAQTTLMITEEDEPVDRTSNPPVAIGDLS